MVDLSDKGSESEDMNSKSPDRASSSDGGVSSGGGGGGGGQVKTCADCGTSKTPLWRGGPAGPKSLCNACGIRSRKKRRALLGLPKEERRPKKAISATTNAAATTTNVDGDDHSKLGGDSMKRKLVSLGREVVLQRPRSSISKPRRKLGEEEQAAFLLMALSCGSVFA